MKQISIVLIFLLSLPLLAVTASDIQDIRQRTEGTRSEVSASEQAQINEFWETSLNTMLLSDNAQDIVAIRRSLEEQAGHEPLSFYTTAYLNAAKQALQSAFANVERIENDQKRQVLKQNLMVLTAQLKSPQLADIALGHLDDQSAVVRYWAVKALTNPGVIQQLLSDVTADAQIQKKILTALKERLTSEPQIEIKIMIVNFAAAIDDPLAREILLSVADNRSQAYKNWSINPDYTALDSRLLIAMGNIAIGSQDAEVKSTFARKFAEMYALVFQAYMKGKDTLTQPQLTHVISVILEVDRTVLDKMLNVTQTGILNAIRRNVGLEREYQDIFGSQLQAGELARIYKFDYGKDNAGRSITEPPVISQPPSPESR